MSRVEIYARSEEKFHTRAEVKPRPASLRVLNVFFPFFRSETVTIL